MTAALGVAAAAMVRDLTYRYPGSAGAALDSVSLEFHPGLTAVAGPSGGGKSTLLRLLNGLVPHFHGGTISGSVAVGGYDALRTPTATLAREVGFVFQDPEAQFVRARVEDEVAFALENTAVPPRLIAGRVDEAMGAAGISALAGRTIDSLSGGERQRVAIASAIALRPRMLVLDEPTSQLDLAGTIAVLTACAELGRSGTTVVLAEHRVSRVLPLASQLAVVEGGRVAGPREVTAMLPYLADPPPLLELGRALSWHPAPLTTESARRLAPALRMAPAVPPRAPREAAWELRGCELGHAGCASVLQQVELSGGVGEVTVLVGPNGGGKTTLLRAIAGLQKPRSGLARRAAGRVAYLPQDPGVLLHRQTVTAEVEYTLRRARSPQTAGPLLQRLRLGDLADKYPGDLSSGQRQRAALAAILAGEPVMALLDEPTRGMDRDARAALTELLKELAAGGTSVVVATHDADLAAAVAHRLVIVDDGGARGAGAPSAALSGDSPYATDIGRLYPGGPVTVAEVLQCL